MESQMTLSEGCNFPYVGCKPTACKAKKGGYSLFLPNFASLQDADLCNGVVYPIFIIDNILMDRNFYKKTVVFVKITITLYQF